jgi:hypothetical protein
VRRAVGVFHPAVDQLKGTEVYGVYGTPTTNATFSVMFASLVNSSSEFLFMTGTSVVHVML